MDLTLSDLAIQGIKRKKVFPVLVMIRPTKRCPAKCQMCNLWKSNIPDLPFEKVQEIIEDSATLGTKEIRITGGEPLLYKHFFETIALVKKKGIESSFITNGVFLNKQTVRRVIEQDPKHIHISLDFPDAKTHNNYRGYPLAWEKAINAIKDIRKQRKGEKPVIIVNFVISNKNFLLLPKFIEMGKGLFDELNVIPIRGMPQWFLNPVQAKEFKENIWPEAKRRAKDLNIRTRSDKTLFCSDYKSISKGEYNKGFYDRISCRVSEFMAFIDTDGQVFPCSNTPYDKSFSYGNVFEKRFKEIWQNKRFEKKRLAKSKVCLACEPTSLLFNQRLNECHFS